LWYCNVDDSIRQVCFRADGNTAMGLGHLYRCLNLADVLARDFMCAFVSECVPGPFREILARRGIPVWGLEAEAKIERQLVVLDYSACDQEAMRSWRERGNVVAVIDDWARGVFSCDVVISPGPQNRIEHYVGLPGCCYLIGPKYAVIHPAFYEQPQRSRREIRRLFVSFGGSDPPNATKLVLAALEPYRVEVDVVLGSAYSHWDTLAPWMTRSGIRLFRDVEQPEMAALMSRADAAVAAGGTMSLELCAVGVPTLLIAVAKDQLRPCAALRDHGLSAYAGWIGTLSVNRLRSLLTQFFSADHDRRRIVEACRAAFVEPGAVRVAAVLKKLANAKSSGLHDATLR
jgi:UDP-2,4-diacetamido-2,4,6-trideoxy-beta-L-altropyranose hydrolase